MWPGGREPYEWGTLYAGHCLLEAKKAGYKVPTQLLDPLLQYTQRQLRTWSQSNRLLTASYGCDLLARAGRTPHRWLSRLEETAKDGESRIYLATAILAAGEADAAKALLSNIIPRRTRERLDDESPDRIRSHAAGTVDVERAHDHRGQMEVAVVGPDLVLTY